MRRRALQVVIGVGVVPVMTLVTAAGCGNDSGAEPDAKASSSKPTAAIEPTETSTTPAAVSTQLVGVWHRAQTCAEMLTAFKKAGLVASHRDWLQGNFYGGKPGPKVGDPCADAQGPLEHDHYFTADGRFGSHDENGQEVDDGDYVAIDADTLTFPSHAQEFGYEGDILVDYAVNADVVTFDVNLPNPCADTCADAYAWALSAFASGPWHAGEVPG